MNNISVQKIKEIVVKIDTEKINNHLKENPNSSTLKQIAKYSKRALGSNEKEKVFKLGVNIAYDLDTLVNKTNYVKDEAEKKHWLEIAKELFENTIGYKVK